MCNTGQDRQAGRQQAGRWLVQLQKQAPPPPPCCLLRSSPCHARYGGCAVTVKIAYILQRCRARNVSTEARQHEAMAGASGHVLRAQLEGRAAATNTSSACPMQTVLACQGCLRPCCGPSTPCCRVCARTRRLRPAAMRWVVRNSSVRFALRLRGSAGWGWGRGAGVGGHEQARQGSTRKGEARARRCMTAASRCMHVELGAQAAGAQQPAHLSRRSCADDRAGTRRA